jgi:hypothetical protein
MYYNILIDLEDTKMQLLFRTLPYPDDTSLQRIFDKYLDKVINRENSEALLKELADIELEEDEMYSTVFICRHVIGRTLPRNIRQYISTRGGVWSLKGCIFLLTAREFIQLLDISDEYSKRAQFS